MRFTINLASQKYADARQFYLRWGAAVVAMLLLTVFLGMKARISYMSARLSGKHIAELKEKIKAKEQERTKAEAILNRPENRDVTEQSSFWKVEFNKKLFSWTELFTDLEKIMPARAFVVSITPSPASSSSSSSDTRVKLNMTIAGEKVDDAQELIRKMEKSERFRFPILKVQSIVTLGKGPPIIQFAIDTYYTPANKGLADATVAKEGMQ
jgi:hypothetical protein